MKQLPLMRMELKEAPGVLKPREVIISGVGKVNTKSGITLVELIVATMIVGILATLALPRYIKTIETTKAREAIASLEQIKHGEIVYREEENTYWPIGATETNVATINFQLGLFLDTREPNWDYSVTATAADKFTATARRTGGGNQNETITLDEDGTEGGTWSP